jgi:hypothetical protein
MQGPSHGFLCSDLLEAKLPVKVAALSNIWVLVGLVVSPAGTVLE